MVSTARSTFRAPAELDLAEIDPRGRPVGPKDKSAAAEAMADLATVLDGRQEALYAEAVGGGTRSVLLVLQGMDTSGKGGVIRHVAGLVNPQGLTISSFKKPTAEERAHHFLWRVRPKVPAPGQIGVFDRSHYEDVLIARVDSLVPEDVWRGRYAEITAFESELAAQGVAIVKCMLHISPEEQAERLLARLDDPAKVWKYNTADLDSRAKWPAYQQAYTDAVRETDSGTAPWYVVPSDRKWYRNWAIASILAETLTEIDPRFPPATVDVETERARIRASVVA
ncbi:PPK2 family polyphosphate kinase [Pseudonocardia petroleophila]|uniref:Polyphosphate kinase 2 family protein n=1 Tax=Pseudonocardia petroleophila TaxID=37331 RepID=A0A7G7MFX9_9PSEU|nr:polyphosphate kinase 2 family protein [Pseudonocardia petroleophila]